MNSIINALIALTFPFIYTTSNTTITQSGKMEVPLSEQTEECLMCHISLHPGIVESWKNNKHAQITVENALNKNELQNMVSNKTINEKYLKIAVGCYECHSLNTDKHTDSFEHNGYKINIVVSSNDCATCHSSEKKEYNENLMSHAYGNLMNNSVYQDLMLNINANYKYKKTNLSKTHANNATNAESCLYCHGTKLEVAGIVSRDTEMGEMNFPNIKGWPNNGVGRINTDGSKGACTSCHPRHDFSIETARKPYTCAECHKGPDVPAYKVYIASKHGNIFKSDEKQYNFSNVPWVIGKDFKSPTCATCHASLIINEDEMVIAKRTHKFNDRLANRLFGVPYAHPHPIHADINKIKNKQNLPLAVELDGTPVSKFLIDKKEQEQRNNSMKKICNSCHAASWTDEHFNRLDNTITTTNKNTLAATNILVKIWDKAYAKGLPQKQSLFDEYIERQWTSVWLFYANSIRFSAAMGGGGDYGVFANGRYQLTNQILKMHDWYQMQEKISKK